MPSYLSDASQNYNQIKRVHQNDPIQKLDYYLPNSISEQSGLSGPTVDFSTQQSSDPRQSSSASSESLSSRTAYSNKLSRLITTQDLRKRMGPRIVDEDHSRAFAAQRTLYPISSASRLSAETNSDSIGEVPMNIARRRSKVGDQESESRRLRKEIVARKFPINNFALTPHSSPLESSGFGEGAFMDQSGWHYRISDIELNANNCKSTTALDSIFERYISTPDGISPELIQQVRLRQNFSDNNQTKKTTLPSIAQMRPEMHLKSIALSGKNRLRRRKITRNNRRMMTDNDPNDGYLSSPYALSELFSQSEIPGFREIFASDSYLRKFCWIVAFLFMTVLSLNDMTELISEYYEYPITVDVRLKDSARLPFPAVTVCNLNAVRFSALCSNSRFELSSQMPSEMRDKLCGIQVEKKKLNKNHSNSDSDIGDINNIGISTTTTPTTTTLPLTSIAPAIERASTTMPVTIPSATQYRHSDKSFSFKAKTSSKTDYFQTNSVLSSRIILGQKTLDRPQKSNAKHRAQAQEDSINWYDQSTWNADHDLLSKRAGKRVNISFSSVQNSNQHSMRTKRSLQLSTVFKRGEDLGNHPFASKRWILKVKATNNPTQTDSLPTPARSDHRSKASQYNALPVTNIALNTPNVNIKSTGAQNNLSSSSVVGGGRQPSNQQPPSTNLAGTNNNQQQQPPMANQGAGSINFGGQKNNQNSMFNFVSPNPNEEFELTERQERELSENLTNWLAVMYQRDPLMTRSLGHQFDDMILRCTMKSINCTRQRSFEDSFSPTEGNCFTFKSKVKRKLSSKQMTIQWDTYEEANLAGTNDGLELVLNLEKNEYISGSSQVGALVMIHHPSDLGYAASEATFIAPEFTTYIGLKMVNISRLPAPYPESCVDSWPAKFADTLTKNSTYSQQACLKICLQKTIQSHCNCQSAFLPIVELDSDQQQQQQHQQQQDLASTTTTTAKTTAHSDMEDSHAQAITPLAASSFLHNHDRKSSLSKSRRRSNTPMRKSFLEASSAQNASSSEPSGGEQPPKQQQQRIIICDTRKKATRMCVREVNLRAADRVHDCECPAKCGVIRYDKTISMARWPTREDKVSFDRGKLDVNFQNLAKVIVYFQTMTCEEVQQQPVFNAAKLFSSLGGIMGMYVGFSFLSVFEIFEVMSRKFWHYLTLRFGNRFIN